MIQLSVKAGIAQGWNGAARNRILSSNSTQRFLSAEAGKHSVTAAHACVGFVSKRDFAS